VRRIEEKALRERRERSAAMVRVASSKLDALYQLVGGSGCGVLLTDCHGVVLELRAAKGDVSAFESWGLAPGSGWSEASEGTNGIGTCITEFRRMIIHRDEHFHARNTAMSCMDAPIFGAEGELIRAPEVSSARADQTASFNRLIAAMVAHTASQIEADSFRAALPSARIFVADAEDRVAATLLEVDGDDLVVGAARARCRPWSALRPVGSSAARSCPTSPSGPRKCRGAGGRGRRAPRGRPCGRFLHPAHDPEGPQEDAGFPGRDLRAGGVGDDLRRRIDD
jgi:transcriptional regulator of acetoin/glycerol metabolism